MLLHQAAYTFRGLILFDPRVSAQGIENHRLKPPRLGGLNQLLVPFFLVGFTLLLTRKKTSWSLKHSALYLSNLLLSQMPSAYIPNWACALSVLPTIYLSVGLGLEWLQAELPEGMLKRHGRHILGVLILVSSPLAAHGFIAYWSLAQSPRYVAVQRPAVTVEEVSSYIGLVRQRIDEDRPVFTLHQWNHPSWREKHLLGRLR